MSVLSYLTDLEKELRLSSTEKASIETSKNNLMQKLQLYFGASVIDTLVFGSYKRNTNLPRKVDGDSDVDILVVFVDNGTKPQAYINRLKKFAEDSYLRSEIYQSSPSVVLELNHIKFELTPALTVPYSAQYRIPDSSNSYADWLYTDPYEIDKRNKGDNYRQNTRLIKYWNILGDKYFKSYGLEKHVVDYTFYSSNNLKEQIFSYLKNFSTSFNYSKKANDYITRTHEIIRNVEQYENDSMPYTAETEIKKLFKEL